jgi:hypothetical protein
MNKNTLLVIGGLLLLVGFVKPDFSNWGISPNKPVAIDVLELSAPSSAELQEKANVVAQIFKDGNKDSKADAKRLRDLYLDIGKLVELDGENQVIKNTEEIRQANSLAGIMLRLDIKGKYPKLPQAAKDVVMSAVGDDVIVLSKELRVKAVEGFNALAWACNEGSK